jgi:hypothetical protein
MLKDTMAWFCEFAGYVVIRLDENLRTLDA